MEILYILSVIYIEITVIVSIKALKDTLDHDLLQSVILLNSDFF